MSISSKIVADSVGVHGDLQRRIITLECRYPRFIHSEVMTHCMFARNAASSRAIPTIKILEDVNRDPAMPIYWGKNQPGMQAKKEHDAPVVLDHRWLGPMSMSPKEAWLTARSEAMIMAHAFMEAGYHKQIVNRILEPYSHITAVITATDWVNFFVQRLDGDAQPEMRALADQMRIAIQRSTPEEKLPGEWHLPYMSRMEDPGYFMSNGFSPGIKGFPPAVKMSAARCARLSYKLHDGKETTAAADLALYDQLVGGEIKHASPTEHQAVFMGDELYYAKYRGWEAHRASIPNENWDAVYPSIEEWFAEKGYVV